MSKNVQFSLINPRLNKLSTSLSIDEIAQQWIEIWEQVYRDLAIEKGNLFESFFNCDQMGILTIDGAFAGSVHFRHFDLNTRSISQLEYFRHYEKVFDGLFNLGLKRLSTGEFFCVSPQVRQSKMLHLAPVLVGLAARVAYLFETQALIGPVRKTHGMDKITKKFGATVLLDSHTGHHNTPIDFVALTQEKFCAFPILKIENQIKMIWNDFVSPNRRDTKVAA